MAINLDDYRDVAERIEDFKAAFPNGSLRPADPSQPYRIEAIGDKTFVVYAAAAYRTADDQAPGIGIAWEPFPGKSNYTRDSELMNAETSAWGRAIIAVLASTSKKIASKQEVRNRRADEESRGKPAAAQDESAMDASQLRRVIGGWAKENAVEIPQVEQMFAAMNGTDVTVATASAKLLLAFLGQLRNGELAVA